MNLIWNHLTSAILTDLGRSAVRKPRARAFLESQLIFPFNIILVSYLVMVQDLMQTDPRLRTPDLVYQIWKRISQTVTESGKACRSYSKQSDFLEMFSLHDIFVLA